jgi:hypothetical protein
LNRSGGPKENRYSTWQEHEFETLMKKFKNTFTLLDENAQPRLENSPKWTRHCREGRK